MGLLDPYISRKPNHKNLIERWARNLGVSVEDYLIYHDAEKWGFFGDKDVKPDITEQIRIRNSLANKYHLHPAHIVAAIQNVNDAYQNLEKRKNFGEQERMKRTVIVSEKGLTLVEVISETESKA